MSRCKDSRKVKKYYWQHPESESCGFVTTREEAEELSKHPDVDVYIPRKLYKQRIKEGYYHE